MEIWLRRWHENASNFLSKPALVPDRCRETTMWRDRDRFLEFLRRIPAYWGHQKMVSGVFVNGPHFRVEIPRGMIEKRSTENPISQQQIEV